MPALKNKHYAPLVPAWLVPLATALHEGQLLARNGQGMPVEPVLCWSSQLHAGKMHQSALAGCAQRVSSLYCSRIVPPWLFIRAQDKQLEGPGQERTDWQRCSVSVERICSLRCSLSRPVLGKSPFTHSCLAVFRHRCHHVRSYPTRKQMLSQTSINNTILM